MARATTKTTLRDLIEEYPSTEEVLGWWGIDLTDDDLDSTLARLCGHYGIVASDVLVDITDDSDDDDDDDDNDFEVSDWVSSRARAR